MNSELKPDAMNGIYKNGDITLICYYETDLEMPNKDKYYEYTFQGNGGKSNKKRRFLGPRKYLDPKNKNIYMIDGFSGQKTKIGEFKGDKIVTIQDDTGYYPVGEYTKKETLPSGKTYKEILEIVKQST